MLDPNDMKTTRLAISYVRWSTPEQKLGDSKRRQVQATEEFCREHKLLLDQQLVDSGLSAYSGKHRREGSALSSFLKDVEAGKVPKGAVLIVESLDRLTRQAIPEALELFLGIIRSGIDIITLIDKQWYSSETIGEVQNLLVSIISLWRAHEDSRHKGERVGKAWVKKRELAVEGGVPMTAACPGWIRLRKISKTESCYELIPERAKKVKLIFWLTLRGWGAQRIAKLFNRHQLPPWGVARRQWGDPKKRRARQEPRGWHHSYIKKVLSNRAVLGEFVPHTVKVAAKQGVSAGRRPAGAVLKDYYPRVISDAVFARVQQRRSGPRGPVGRRIANLFQGLLKDGDHAEYTMCYKDHGRDWRYVVSDHRRVHPSEPIFSWPYDKLETLVLNYLVELDWSGLTVEQTAELKRLKAELAEAEGALGDLDRQVKRLVKLVQMAGDIQETAQELETLEKQRVGFRTRVHGLRSALASKRAFSIQEGADLVRKFASDRENVQSRLRLRQELRKYVEQVELYRTVPAQLLKGLDLPPAKLGVKLNDLLHARCVRVVFRNGAERWLVDRGGQIGVAVRFDGETLPSARHITVNRDRFGGGVIVDAREDSSLRGETIKLQKYRSQRKR